MPMIVQRSKPSQLKKPDSPSKPWFGVSRVAQIVRLSIESTIKQAGAKMKATPKELKEATAMRQDWDGEAMGKVLEALRIGRSTGFSRGSGL